MVVHFIQRAGHEARSFFFRRHDRTSSQTHFCQALLWEVSSCLSLSPPPPLDKKANIKRGPCIFFSLSRSLDFFQRQPAMVFRFKKKNGAADRLTGFTVPLHAHFDSLIPPVLVCRNQCHNIRRHQKVVSRLMGLASVFLFVRSGENFR